ncbi:acetylxylan esterase [Larkinella arboricola]
MQNPTSNRSHSNPQWIKALATVCIYFVLHSYTYAQKEFDVIRDKWVQYSDPANLLNHHLSAEAFALLKQQEKTVAGLKTKTAWQARQAQMKEKLWKVLGPFSDKSPLNPKVTGVIQKDGFKLENIIFESQPGFYVTATLFIPNGVVTPGPAILFCSGHSTIAYRRDIYQLPLLNLVKKGFIVLAIDPVAQGERMQYMDEKTGKSLIGGSTHEHSYPAVQALLVGKSIARHFVWDGIRAIDYLATRPEVDMSRIGVHGLSGGGTQAAYIAALDDRVAAAAPSGYITGFRRLLESVGAQDGEQNFYHGLSEGIDHADLLEMRAPKPVLVMATTRDFFSIQGTRETVSRVKKTYGIFGKPENIASVEGDYEHGYTQNIREGMYQFFQKHLGLKGDARELPVEYLTEKELQKTPTGQLASSYKGESLFSLNLKDVVALNEKAKKRRGNPEAQKPALIANAKSYSGFRPPVTTDQPVFTGRTAKEGYVIEKYFIKGEGHYPIPYLLFIPDKPVDKVLIYVHPGGKSAEAAPNGEIEWFVNQGITVLAPDLIGTGELAPDNKGDAVIAGVSYNLFFTSTLIGRSILGIQVADLLKLKEVLAKRAPRSELLAMAKNEMGSVLVHAAAFDHSIKRIALSESYISYHSIGANRFYKPSYVFSLVPGALQAYDLPDLLASLVPRKLLLINTTNGNGDKVEPADMKADLEVVTNSYQAKSAKENFSLLSGIPEKPYSVYADWIK